MGQTSSAFYTLEDTFELVTGPWVIEIWYGDRKLAEQSFNVINPQTDCESDSCEGF